MLGSALNWFRVVFPLSRNDPRNHTKWARKKLRFVWVRGSSYLARGSKNRALPNVQKDNSACRDHNFDRDQLFRSVAKREQWGFRAGQSGRDRRQSSDCLTAREKPASQSTAF